MAELRGRGFLVGEMEDPLKLTLKYPDIQDTKSKPG